MQINKHDNTVTLDKGTLMTLLYLVKYGNIDEFDKARASNMLVELQKDMVPACREKKLAENQ